MHISQSLYPNSLISPLIYPPTVQSWANPILDQVQASTKEMNVAGEKTTILTDINFKFVTTHFK